jgi:non-ribosomal peptide synthetase component F
LAAKLAMVSGLAIPQDFVAPRTRLEKMLAESWAEILQIQQVGLHDDFFALGGDSLLVTHVLARVYEVLNLEIDVSRFFDAPTVAELADHLESLIQAGQVGQPSSAIVRVLRENGVPASIAQERIWKLQRALPGIPLFNALYPLRLTSAFDAALLARSVNEIVRRHEILRTTFAVVDGRCVQVIAPRMKLLLTFDDLDALHESTKVTAGHQLIQQELLHSFDLAQGPLVRARLVRLSEREHLLLFTLHQIIGDGWSLGVLVDELADLYDAFSAGEESPLVPLPIQYADFAYWQRHWRSHPDIVSQLAYWREQLRDPLPVLELATGRPRTIIDSFRTAQRELVLPPSLSEAAKRFSRHEGGTLFMALVTALKMVLHCYLGQDDLRVATLVANRNRPGTEGLIGALVNTVILRTNLGGDLTPREVMRRVRATTVAAFANQDLPFEELVDALEHERALKPAALAQVMITLHNATLRPFSGSGHTLTFEMANPSMLMPVVQATTFDVILALHETTDGIVGFCLYKPHLFEAATVDQLLRDFQKVLQQMVTQPEQPLSAVCVGLNNNP